MITKLSAPINVQWELTPWCNNSCIHCYNYWRTEKSSGFAFTDNQNIILEKSAQEIVDNKIFCVTLTGGEPLVGINKYREFIQKIRDAGTIIHLNSTLTLLTPQIAELLIELNISSILVSLISSDEKLHDSIAQRSGAFRKTINGIKIARKKGLRVAVNMVVSKLNMHTVRTTGKLANEIGAAVFCATKAAAPTNCPDFSPYRLAMNEFHKMLEDLLWIKKNYGIAVDSLEHYVSCSFPNNESHTAFGSRSCLAGKTSATIGFDGEIRPCSHAHISYGNVLDGLIVAWENMDEWREGTLVPTYCKTSCDEYANQKCGGGCRIDAFSTYGDLTALDPYCVKSNPTTKRNPRPWPNVPDQAKYKIRENIMSRTEKFGYIIFSSPSKWTAVDNKMFDFLHKSESFVVDDIALLYDVPLDQATKSVQHLLSRKLVKMI